MKRLCGLCILIAVFLCSCGVNVAQKSQQQVKDKARITSKPTEMPEETVVPEPTEDLYEIIERKNIKIKGRTYKYAAYIKTTDGKIALLSLKTEEDELYIPSEIEGSPVIMLGGANENIGITGYEWSQQINVDKLGWNLEKEERRLKRVIIGEGIERIDDFVVAADEIIIPKSMKEIEDSSFYGAEIKRVFVKSSRVTLGSRAFCQSTLEQIHLPDDFHGEIQLDCFYGSNLKEFRWPAYGKQKERDFGRSVFQECNKLKKITFPENQERIVIPHNSFFRCKSLTKLEFPASTKKVVYEASHYADNYKHGVSTLIFKGKDTKLEGGDILDVNSMTDTKVPHGLSLLTVKKIIAPRGSKAIRFAKKAVKIAELNEWKEEDVTCENRLDEPAVIPEDLVPVEYEIRN